MDLGKPFERITMIDAVRNTLAWILMKFTQ